MGFSDGAVVKNLPTNAGDARGVSLIPGFGRWPGGGRSNQLQYSWLGNPMDRGSWWATVHIFGYKNLDTTEHTHSHIHIHTQVRVKSEGNFFSNNNTNKKCYLSNTSVPLISSCDHPINLKDQLSFSEHVFEVH